MKPNSLILGAVLAMVAALQPALADGPKYVFQHAKKGVKVVGPDVGLPNPGAPVAGGLEVSQRAVSFGTAWITSPAVSRYVTLTNKTAQPVSFTYNITGGAPEFTASGSCTSLAAGASCDIQVAFAATAEGSRAGGLQVTTADGKSTSVQLSGSGRATSVTLSTPTFTDAVFPSNTEVTGVARLTNNSYQPLTVTRLGRGEVSPAGGFSVVSNTCGTSLAPEASCDITIRLSTTTSGPRTATFGINTGAGLKQVPLSGNVIAGTATLSASYMNFGHQELNVTSAPQSVQLTNTGNAVLNISSMSFATNGDSFGRSNTCGSPLQPGQSCTISVAFTPLRAEYIQGELSIVHDGNGSKNLSAYGTGIPPLPQITEFIYPEEIKANQPATITWTTKNAVYANLTCNNATVTNSEGLQGSATIVAPHPELPLDCGIYARNAQGYTTTAEASIRVVE